MGEIAVTEVHAKPMEVEDQDDAPADEELESIDAIFNGCISQLERYRDKAANELSEKSAIIEELQKRVKAKTLEHATYVRTTKAKVERFYQRKVAEMGKYKSKVSDLQAQLLVMKGKVETLKKEKHDLQKSQNEDLTKLRRENKELKDSLRCSLIGKDAGMQSILDA